MRALDFIVIGTQKGGTTSLWQYLRHHPSIVMPTIKEAPFFCFGSPPSPSSLASFMARHFGEAPNGALLGKATTHYMMGFRDVDVDEIASRVADALPDVRLIALLRDPVERAISHYRMSVRRGFESRSFDAAIAELLEPDALADARSRPTETNSYAVQGEYGRILGAYRSRFPAERLHVEYTRDLARDPGGVIDRLLGFLGLPSGYRPESLDVRYHRGGSRRRLDLQSEELLFEFLRENVWPRLGEGAEQVERMFAVFYEIWSVVPDENLPAVSASICARLRHHFEADAEVLRKLGIAAPWLADWSGETRA